MVQTDQGPGSVGARGRRGGIEFAVSRQAARKQAVGPVRKGTTKDISALIAPRALESGASQALNCLVDLPP